MRKVKRYQLFELSRKGKRAVINSGSEAVSVYTDELLAGFRRRSAERLLWPRSNIDLYCLLES